MRDLSAIPTPEEVCGEQGWVEARLEHLNRVSDTRCTFCGLVVYVKAGDGYFHTDERRLLHVDCAEDRVAYRWALEKDD